MVDLFLIMILRGKSTKENKMAWVLTMRSAMEDLTEQFHRLIPTPIVIIVL